MSPPILAREGTRLGSPGLEQPGNISEANPTSQAAGFWTPVLELSRKSFCWSPPRGQRAGPRQDGVLAAVGMPGMKWPKWQRTGHLQ